MHVRTPIALTVAALLAAPQLASAQARGPRAQSATAGTAASRALSVGGYIGFESGDLSGLSLRLDGEMPLQALSPQIALSLVGSLGYTHFGKDVQFGDLTFNLFKVVPAARFTLPLNPQFDVYGDAGLGLYYYRFSTRQDLPFFGTIEDSGSGVGLMMRLGVGAFYKVSPQLRLGAEFGILPYFNKVDTTDVSLLVGAMFAI
ncbi:MAG: outer membrane beta-barrel protein [Anaeromyxobacteraceae bacterium]